MPKNTDEEKAARKEAMQKALKEATLVPYSIMELCLESLKVTEMGLGCTNTKRCQRFGVASLNLKSAVQGAWLNVLMQPGPASVTKLLSTSTKQRAEQFWLRLCRWLTKPTTRF